MVNTARDGGAAPAVPSAHAGCVFAMRCPHKLGSVCDAITPPFKTLSDSHAIACHLDIGLSHALSPVSLHPVAPRATGAC